MDTPTLTEPQPSPGEDLVALAKVLASSFDNYIKNKDLMQYSVSSGHVIEDDQHANYNKALRAYRNAAYHLVKHVQATETNP